MSFRPPIRTVLLALIVIAVAVMGRRHMESRIPSPIVDEDAVLAPVRVARDVQPTIVEPNDNWLESSTDALEPSHLSEAHAPALLPPETALPTEDVSPRLIR
jgi:hypothetical protein